ncbi:MAG: DEAD/DEAH box helicase family protein [Chloroflexi bacterium]|nr:DEAD/DEAH box helicase family protein [Chloroflexota bacterium]
MSKEAMARIRINDLLTRAGWRFFKNEHGDANITLETHTKYKKQALEDLGDDFENTAYGFVDYILLGECGFPVAVLEAKAERLKPLVGKEQARRYAQSQHCRFVLLSNGNLHYFWDLVQGNPILITEFPRPESLQDLHQFRPNPAALSAEVVEADYIALTQNPHYAYDPRWADPAQRPAYVKEAGLKFLRPYQLRAITALQDAVRKNGTRFLFEMATGTGKTLVAAAVIKLFVRTGNAKRVLFLVDRIELENQAKKSFDRTLKQDLHTVIYKENRDDWRKAEIVVTTVQSLMVNERYRELFSPTDFELVISDEAHRSIGGNARAVFEYFVGYKLGLTATPKDYLKNLDPAKLNERDPRAWERRQLLDTYKTFGCESGVPTFRYGLVDGVQDGYLLNPLVVDARTEITTELLSQQGYAAVVETEDGEKVEQSFFGKDFEKRFFSDRTNHVFCRTFLENALRDPLSGEIGKSIVFCVRQDHALRIAQTLNELADEMFPGMYNSDFALQVTSDVEGAQQMAVSFANNNLNGHTRFLEGYPSSKTRVCVTVGMMTTGYDCEDLLNIALLRPIFSPTDFIQIKGRGTRRFTFEHTDRSEGWLTRRAEEKKLFKLLDFFANCAYFEHEFKYDQVLKLPPLGPGSGEGPVNGRERPTLDSYRADADRLKKVALWEVPKTGMKVDRMYFDRFAEQVKADPEVRRLYENGDIPGAEALVRDRHFNRPEDYFNLERLREHLHLDRRVSLRELLAHALGETGRPRTRDELLADELAAFVSLHQPPAEAMPALRRFFDAYITDAGIREIIESGAFSQLADNPRLSMDDLIALGKWRRTISDYVKDYISLNAFLP